MEWHVLAESDDIVTVEGNATSRGLGPAPHCAERNTDRCPWKGTASYYSVRVDGEIIRDAALYYPEPKDAAQEIAGRIAFWRGVVVRDI
jgi:uncharacterized protein (DUF427 family)